MESIAGDLAQDDFGGNERVEQAKSGDVSADFSLAVRLRRNLKGNASPIIGSKELHILEVDQEVGAHAIQGIVELFHKLGFVQFIRGVVLPEASACREIEEQEIGEIEPSEIVFVGAVVVEVDELGPWSRERVYRFRGNWRSGLIATVLLGCK